MVEEKVTELIKCNKNNNQGRISTICLVVFIVVSDFEIRSGFVDIDGIVDHHGLKTFFS
jgi:hypothetical protein